MRRFVLMVAMGLVGGSARAQNVHEGPAERPPPLAPVASCELWKGTASGNDPSAEVAIRLCPAGDSGALTGTLQWSSLLSGWSERELTGQWLEDRQHLILHDVRFTQYRPQPTWRFCPADVYDLRRVAPNRLDGTYLSTGCDDHATLTLTRIGDVASAGAAPTDVTPSPEAPKATGWGCDATAGSPDGTGLGAVLVLLAALAARRSVSQSPEGPTNTSGGQNV